MSAKSAKRQDFSRQLMAGTDGSFRIGQCATSASPGVKSREEAEAALGRMTVRLAELQQLFYGDGRRSLLVVLQGMDTSGKDGTIRHVFGPLNPQGIRVAGFKAPTAVELAHDYLWRIHRQVPPKGMIGIFNRSHYEDVLIARVHNLAPKKEIARRYGQINAFERHLTENGVAILKFCLHISKEEQKERLQARLDRADKHWKFDPGDVEERKRWDDYQRAYELAIAECSTPWAPWYVIPADRKWYRNYAVARIVRDTLEGMGLRYPDPPPGLDTIVIGD